MAFLPILLLSALLTLGSPAARADETLHVSGFGTLGYVFDDHADVAPARDISQLPKHSYNTGGSWEVDTRFGIQVEYKPTPMLDLVGQFVARDHFRANLDSATELAYAALHPHADLDIRVGRINYDAFLMSDHRNVGYAYAWVRPPLEFYGWIPIFSLNGIDAAYTLPGDDARWRLKAQAGNSHFYIPVDSGRDGGYHFKADNLFSVSVTRQTAFWRLKAAHSRFTSTREVPAFAALHSGLEGVAAAGTPGVSAEAADLRQQLAFKNARISYTTLGAVYDDNTWQVQAELGVSTSTAAVVPTARMAYVGAGRRFGNWMPFAMLSTSRPGALRTAANDWGAALNTSLRDPAVRTVNALRIDQTTLSIGTRWDFRHNAALKVQWDHTRSSPPGYGVGNRSAEAARQSLRLNLISATLDFVF